MRGFTRSVAVMAAAALIVTACGDNGDNGDNGDDGLGAPTGEDLSGTSVAIFGAFSSVEADAVNAVIEEYFNEPTGSEAFYEGSDDFEQQVRIRVEGGNPPDIAIYPQPGAVIEQAEAGNAISLEELGFDIDELRATFGDYLIGLGEYEGQHYGLPTNVNLKSLVWYNKPFFDEQGYEIPETWDDLVALSEQAVSDGVTPWCIGTGSDAATGWPATDWMEDIMLRTAGPELYDQWVSNEIPFNHESVVTAAETMAEITHRDEFVLGGTASIPDIDFRQAPDPMFADPPGCILHRQASFITNFFPEGAVVGEDVDVFPFPEIEPGLQGAMGGGELAAVFENRPEVVEFVRVFMGEEAQCAQGSFEGVARISPNINTSADCYDDPVVAISAETLLDALEAGSARFDASDLMPSAVGAGSFWTGMNEWMRGKDTQTVLDEIEASWP